MYLFGMKSMLKLKNVFPAQYKNALGGCNFFWNCIVLFRLELSLDKKISDI